MTHDPLCPQQPRADGNTLTMLDGKPVYCICDLIAKVREDERANVTAEFMSNHGGRWEYEAGVAAGRAEALSIRVREVMPYANGYMDGEDHMLAKCIDAVEAVSHDFYCASLDVRKPPCNCPQGDALDALRALEEKP